MLNFFLCIISFFINFQESTLMSKQATSSKMQPLSVAPMVYHTPQSSVPNSYLQHQQQYPPHTRAQYIQRNNNNNNSVFNYPNHVQVIHPYPPHHQSQHYSIHYSSATPPPPIHDNQLSPYYFNNGQGIESYPTASGNCNRLLKRDTQSCDDLCSSSDISNGKVFLESRLFQYLLHLN